MKVAFLAVDLVWGGEYEVRVGVEVVDVSPDAPVQQWSCTKCDLWFDLNPAKGWSLPCRAETTEVLSPLQAHDRLEGILGPALVIVVGHDPRELKGYLRECVRDAQALLPAWLTDGRRWVEAMDLVREVLPQHLAADLAGVYRSLGQPFGPLPQPAQWPEPMRLVDREGHREFLGLQAPQRAEVLKWIYFAVEAASRRA